MPRTIIATLLCYLLAAPAWCQEPIPIFWGAKKGLVRAGLVGAWNLGTQNEVLYSEDFSNAAWTKADASATATVLTATADGGTVTQSKASLSTKAYTFRVELKRKTGTGAVSVQMKAGTVQACTINATDYAACTITYTTSGVETLVYGVLFATNTDEVYARYAQLNEGAAALAYVATTDLQTVPNLVAGGPALQLGSTSGADTNDPVRRLSGMVFSTDDYLAGPALDTVGLGASVVYKMDNISAAEILLAKRSGTQYSWEMSRSGGSQQMLFRINHNDNTPTYPTDASTSYQHVYGGYGGVRIDGGFNGELNATPYAYSTAIGAYGLGLKVGARKDYSGAEGYFNGTISHVLLYNRALSAKEVRQNHQWLKVQMANVGVTLP